MSKKLFEQKESNFEVKEAQLEISEVTENLDVKEIDVEVKDVTDTIQVKDVIEGGEITEEMKAAIREKLKEQLSKGNLSINQNHTKYFTLSKGKKVFNLDSTNLIPSKLTLLNIRKFEQSYKQQLEALFFNDRDMVDMKDIAFIMFLYGLINKGDYPIEVKSIRFKHLLSRIVKVLNEFFNEQKGFLESTYKSINSEKDSEEERRQGNKGQLPLTKGRGL